jgi:hypothetical protein
MRGALVALVCTAVVACEQAPTVPTPDRAGEPRLAAATSTMSRKTPFDEERLVPCANGGAGEIVALHGTLHELFHITSGPAGTLTIKFLGNSQGIFGIGLTTGDRYRGTGSTHGTFTMHKGTTNAFIDNFRLVGPGPDNDFFVHETAHTTVNAKGELTVSTDKFTIDCK